MIKMIALFLVLFLLTGCTTHSSGDVNSSELSSITSSQTVSSSSIPSSSTPVLMDIPIQLKKSGKVTIYTYWVNSQLYEPFIYNISKQDLTVNDMINLVGEKLKMPIPMRGLKKEADKLILDLDKSFMETYGKQHHAVILDTLATTLLENITDIKSLQLQLDGEMAGLLGANNETGEYNPMPLKLITKSDVNYKALREKIPYEGLRDVWSDDTIIELDATGKKLSEFISRIGYISIDVNSPLDLSNDFINETLLVNTKSYTSDKNNQNDNNYREELELLKNSISERLAFEETMFYLKEHVEQTAKILFGEEFKVKHKNLYQYKYFEKEGVYTPPHNDSGGRPIAVVFNYEDCGDVYKVETAYIQPIMGGTFEEKREEQWINIPIANLKTYVQEKAIRREVILKKTTNGGLNFVSCKVIK